MQNAGGDDFDALKCENPNARKLWVIVLTDNRNPSKGRSMSFIAPKIVNGEVEVLIAKEDIRAEIQFWEPSLVLYVLGGEMSMNGVKNFMARFWNFVPLPDIYYNEEGYFILRFKDFNDRDEVLMRGPYTFRSMPILIREWRPDFNLKTDFLRTLPLWVKFPQLPIYLWGDTSLNKIGSAVGNPFVTDECTANRLRVSYAIILVEVDVTKDLPRSIMICDDSGNKMEQRIEFEWRPAFCKSCQKLGHNCDKPKVQTKQWQPRTNKPVETKPEVPELNSPIDEPEAKVAESSHQQMDVNWSAVKRGKDLGNYVKTPPVNLLSDNGFDALGILNDLLELQNPG